MRIRLAEEDDLHELGSVFARSAGYLIERYRPDEVGHFPLDAESRIPLYRHLRATGAVFVAEDAGAAVGFSAAIVREDVWFLSQLWVVPEHHGGGIGSSLLEEALTWGGDVRVHSVVGSPHPAAQLVYLRAEMYPLWVQIEMTGGVPPFGDLPPGVEEAVDGDRARIDALDREVRGTARPEDHAFWGDRGARALVLRRDGEVAGYLCVWPDGKVGPGAVADTGDAPSLLRAALARIGGPITVAVPSSNWTALRECVRLGLSPMGANTFLASRPIGDATRYLSSGGALA